MNDTFFVIIFWSFFPLKIICMIEKIPIFKWHNLAYDQMNVSSKFDCKMFYLFKKKP